MKAFRDEYNYPDLESVINTLKLKSSDISLDRYGDSEDYLAFIDILGIYSPPLRRYPQGWANGRSDKEILQALGIINQNYRNEWQSLLSGFKDGDLPPVIMINNRIYDGAHRSILSYLFKVPIRVAYFSVNKY